MPTSAAATKASWIDVDTSRWRAGGAKVMNNASADERTNHERGQRERRSPPDEALRVGECKTKEHNVAGHIGHKYMTECQVT